MEQHFKVHFMPVDNILRHFRREEERAALISRACSLRSESATVESGPSRG